MSLYKGEKLFSLSEVSSRVSEGFYRSKKILHQLHKHELLKALYDALGHSVKQHVL
jgi:hypothetical protein